MLADEDGEIRYEVWRPFDGGTSQVRGLHLTATGLSVATFHHIVMTYSGAVVYGYIDGVKTTVFDTAGLAPDTGSVLLWGCRGDLSLCLDGWTIDDLAIYDFQLDEVRAKAHYELGK